jgi:protoheme IX farnesyltransferase
MIKSAVPAAPAPVAGPLAAPGAPARLAAFVTLAKPRVNLLVVGTTFGGYYMGAGAVLDPLRLVNTVAGTFLVAAGAAALNQVYERDTDGMMMRTRNRPLPSGRVEPTAATLYGLLLALIGLVELLWTANALAALVALVTFLSYVGIYTPLKRYSSLAMLVGGVPGGLPPVIGWAASRGDLSVEAWVLFGIMFLWQMPHFLAIAWMCREDYARAGFPMLPVLEPDGRSTAAQVVLYGSVLIPVSLVPAALGVAGHVYFTAAGVLGVLFLTLGLRFARRRERDTARGLFLGSVAYLPLLWAVMLADRIV